MSMSLSDGEEMWSSYLENGHSENRLKRNWPFPDCALGPARFLFLLQVLNSRQHAEIFD